MTQHSRQRRWSTGLGAAAIAGLLLVGCATPAPVGTTDGTPVPPVAASTTTPAAASTCPDPGPADPATAAGWIGYLAAHPDQVALVVDDGRSEPLRHRPDAAQPAASAAKLVHLAAYARAVDTGTLDPTQPITVGEWEQWYLPGLDGGAHPAALADLGIALDADGLSAADPTVQVTVDDLARVMIRFSDNAAADLLRDRLGDDALLAAVTATGASANGGTPVELPSYLGAQIALLDPSGTAADGAAELAAAQRYATDDAERARVRALPAPPVTTQLTWTASTATATADALRAVAADLVVAADDPARPGAQLAREHLEWPPTPAGAAGLGAKGGSLPGALTEVFVLRHADGTIGTATLMVQDMDAPTWAAAVSSFAHQKLLVTALQDPDTLTGIRCALSAG